LLSRNTLSAGLCGFDVFIQIESMLYIGKTPKNQKNAPIQVGKKIQETQKIAKIIIAPTSAKYFISPPISRIQGT